MLYGCVVAKESWFVEWFQDPTSEAEQAASSMYALNRESLQMGESTYFREKPPLPPSNGIPLEV